MKVNFPFVVLALVLTPLSASGQLVCSLGGAPGGYTQGLDGPSTNYALAVARKVARVLCNGSCGVSLFQNATAPNALTFVDPFGAAKIVYSPDFLWAIERSIGQAAVFGILAHEVGHVADGRTSVSWMLDSWGRELRADAWAGCALARAGMSIAETRAALMAVSQYPAYSHPAWNLRLPALDTGYHSCGGKGDLPTF